jgi:lysophospholipase L1-like esterase
MPLGDSLTHGHDLAGGYRVKLAMLLDRDGDLDVAFVGSQRNGSRTASGRDHEGHPGFRIDEIAASVDGWLRRNTPDIVLLMIGTNDVVQDYDLDDAPARLGDLIDRITTTAPQAGAIVASIPPIGGSPNRERVVAYNAEIPAVVEARAGNGGGVSFVDINGVIELADLHTDHTHLNASGHCKAAGMWHAAIRAATGLRPTSQEGCRPLP